MEAFEVYGGNKLKGELIPQGAKNEALQILCAVLLTPEPVHIENVPDIVDINKLIHLLEDLGVKVELRVECVFNVLRLAEAVLLALVDLERARQAFAKEGLVHQLSLIGWHDLMFISL